jgi:hypothetical protein
MLSARQAKDNCIEVWHKYKQTVRTQEGYRRIYARLEQEVETNSSKGVTTAFVWITNPNLISKEALDLLVLDLKDLGYGVDIREPHEGFKITVAWN